MEKRGNLKSSYLNIKSPKFSYRFYLFGEFVVVVLVSERVIGNVVVVDVVIVVVVVVVVVVVGVVVEEIVKESL